LKRISKRVCKNKTSGASVVQNVKRNKAIHAYPMNAALVGQGGQHFSQWLCDVKEIIACIDSRAEYE
jgi:hypothetical protein